MFAGTCTVHVIMVYMYMCIIVCEVVLLVLYCLLVSVNSVYLFTISPVIITCFCVSWLCSESNTTSQNICLEFCQNIACCTCVPANTCTCDCWAASHLYLAPVMNSHL